MAARTVELAKQLLQEAIAEARVDGRIEGETLDAHLRAVSCGRRAISAEVVVCGSRVAVQVCTTATDEPWGGVVILQVSERERP